MHCVAWKEPAVPVMPWNRTLVFLSTRIAMGLRRLHCGDDLLRAIRHRVGELNVEAALSQDLLTELDVRAFEPYDQRHLEPEIFGSRDHALGDHVAFHDAAEDVDE